MTPHDLMQTYLTEVGAKGRYDLIPDLAQPDMVDEANRIFGGPPGRDGLVAHAKGFRRAFEDLDMTVHRIVAGQTDVMAHWSFSGTQVKPWLNRAPSQGRLNGTVFSFFDLTDGKISRYRLWLCAMFDPPVIFDSATGQVP